jgi:uncharacterized membrane protein (DUF485 family)
MSQPGPPQDKLAVVSVILGVVALITSWVLIGIFFGIAAIVTGRIGRSRTDRSAARPSRVATTGIVLGAVSIMAGLVAAVCYAWIYAHPAEHHHCKDFDTYQRC